MDRRIIHNFEEIKKKMYFSLKSKCFNYALMKRGSVKGAQSLLGLQKECYYMILLITVVA
jgi:hypothetical protein